MGIKEKCAELAYETQVQRETAIASYVLGEQLHEGWREGRKQEDGSYTPRWKGVEDKALNDKTPEEAVAMGRNANEVVDIANTEFADLPPKWQGENLEAGKFVAENFYAEFRKAAETGVPVSEARIEEMAEQVHIAWSERNSWEELSKVPYDELSREEQLKDIAQLKACADLAEGAVKDGMNLDAAEKRFGIVKDAPEKDEQNLE